MSNKFARNSFPYKSSYAISPVIPENINIKEKIISLFKQILQNDLIIDTNAPLEKDKFRMVFRHCLTWEIEEGDINVSHITTSESHGYGMMILAYMAGCEESLDHKWIPGCVCIKDYFDAMLRTVLEFPSSIGKNNHLFAWELFGFPADGENKSGYKQTDGIKTAPFTKDQKSADCATDGDMDIICALLLADSQWGSDKNYNYKQIALDMLECLWNYCVHKKYFTLLLGDWTLGNKGVLGSAVRISDIIPAHLKVFAKTDKEHDWQKVLDASYNVIRDLCESKNLQNGLLPDFAIFKDGKWKAPKKTILEGDDGSYSYNACRVPWRLGSDYLLYGDTKINTSSLFNLIVKPLNEFTSAFTDIDQLGPFNLDGSPLGERDPETFAAPFLVTAAAGKANPDWVEKIWNWQGLDDYNGDNYGDYVKLLSMLTASGNTWLPSGI
ncbi:MAG: glycosyl hydrolase family 8 [Treponema sp.]|nr:glycosyl hydrolase family 8 [Treponema sp.]MCL2272551.1 glycosyl hydrolase family 8 [Treponema sp.]